jgi:hypothetical protein
MSKICSENECNREVFENGKCILHCEKDDWNDENIELKEWHKIEEKIKVFWDEIRQHVEESLPEVNFLGVNFKKFIFPGILFKEGFPDDDYYSFYKDYKTQKKKKLIFRECTFLYSISIPVFNVAFHNCTFQQLDFFINDSSKSLELIGCKKFFGECTIYNFKKSPLTNPNSQEIPLNIKIRHCKFNNDINIKQLWISELLIDNTSFEKLLKLSDCLIEEIDITNDESDKDKKMINKIVFENNKFGKKSDIHFKNVDIGFLSFKNNINYSEYISFFDTKILKELEFNNINLSNTEFHNCDVSECNKIKIKNVAFQSNNGFTVFNGVKWGNIAKTFDSSTNRDTFRQLKYVNEKQGDIIEANKFYSAEMKAYKKELKGEKWKTHWQDKIIFWLNEKVSNFSQNWLKPFGWFFLIGFIAFVLSNFCKIISYLEDTSKINLTTLWNAINQFFEYLNPFNTSAGEWNPTIWLIFKALSIFIIYQFIISLRRQTRR